MLTTHPSAQPIAKQTSTTTNFLPFLRSIAFALSSLLPHANPCPIFADTAVADPVISQESAPAKSSNVSVSRVEPPSWWTGSKTNPVRILLYGHGLDSTLLLLCDSDHIHLTSVQTSENGHYLFADLHIAPDCPPGIVPIRLHRSTEEPSLAEFSFEVLPTVSHQPQGFDANDFIYFLMPDRFCDGDPTNNAPEKSPSIFDRTKSRYYHGGDLRGITNRLDYIESLGATAIWTTPIYDNNDEPDLKEMHPEPGGSQPVPTTGYHGYGATDLYGIDEHFGSMQDLQTFIREAHARGMKVIQDQVANHTGPYHVWVNDPPTPTWWNGSQKSHSPNNWQKWTAMNPRAAQSTQASNLNGWFVDILPDFNQDDPEVERYLIQNSIWWLGVAGYDAIRMDTLPHVPRKFWERWASAVKKEFPNTKILGELYDSDPVLVAYYQGGRKGHDGIDTQIDALFDFGLFTPIRETFAKGESIREIHKMFARDWIYVAPDRLATFVGVHDMPRFMNEKGASIEGLQCALSLIMTSRGTPILYYGDELAMLGGTDPDNRRDFPGGFPGDQRNAFDPSGRTESEQQVWDHVAKLGALRKSHGALRTGKSYDLLDNEQQFAYARTDDNDVFIVVINNDDQAEWVEFPLDDPNAKLPIQPMKQKWSFQCDDLLGKSAALRVEQGRAKVRIDGKRSAIYRMPN